MLLSRQRNASQSIIDRGTIHNYYERLVREEILMQDPRARNDVDYIDDISCVALNHLPPRYIRHDVDMSFYLSPIEWDEIHQKVADAVTHAIEFVQSRETSGKKH